MTASVNTLRVDDPSKVRTPAEFVYTRAAMGLPTDETFEQYGLGELTRTFHYDDLHRLTGVDYPNEPNEEVFELDLAGNRITYSDRDGDDANYFSNTANQYTDIQPYDYDPNYDAAGNMTNDHRGYKFSYDHDNKLTQVQTPPGGSGVLVMFWFDALGRRIAKTADSVTTLDLYSGQNVLAEYDATPQRLRYYVHGPTYIDER
ncbi:MAG: hypothetical protein JXQ73_20615, partial [Phycisphaerae bacterium]|nr:hypothetical protein [Phycisphaerae bacterium]